MLLLLVECTPSLDNVLLSASVVLKVRGGGAPRWKKLFAKEKQEIINENCSGGKLVGNWLRIRGRDDLTMVVCVPVPGPSFPCYLVYVSLSMAIQ